MRAAFLLVLALSAVQAPVQGPLGLAVRVAPEPTYIERTPAGQLLTCDFEIVNGTDQALELVGIWARSFAANGRLLLRNKVDSNGTRPSVEVLGRRRLEPRSTLTVFNPFTELRTAVPIARIEYEFSLQDSSKERQRVKAEVRPIPFRQKTRLILPVAGARLWVYDGPGLLSHHRRLDLADPMNRDVLKLRGNSERYALDLVVVDEKGEFARGDLEKKESWFGWGFPVVAPAAGTVVEAVDSLPDDIPYDEAKMREDPRGSVGNRVILDHGNGEYSLLAHFRNGSLKVRPGQKVRQGDVLGQMG
ncbi:MAG: M23 family metallopeptidase, partial [Thermoanaerobaculia bacterium]